MSARRTLGGYSPLDYAVSDATERAYIALMLGGGAEDHEPDPDPAPAGQQGECWTNAREYAQRDPGRFCYVEGIVALPGRDWELHGYVLDRQDDHVVETTRGYELAENYVGITLSLDRVRDWSAAHPDYAGNGVIWSMLCESVESTLLGIIGLRDITGGQR
jgi:hypothetical protein